MSGGENILAEYMYLIIIILIGVIFLAVYLAVQLRQSDRRKKEIETQMNKLEYKLNNFQLETIESKLNPHLFKNILNSIQAHAYQTYFAIDKLANVLDYILYDSHKKYVTPKEEIDFAMSLIEINKIKLSPLFDLKIKSKIHENEPLYTQSVLAPLVSIELIENAFKHADLQSPDAFISVTFSFIDSVFSLTVANKISAKEPMKKEYSGIGEKSMEQRLRIIYGENYKLNKFVEDNCYIAHLKINLLEHKAKMLAFR
ncbi:MAG TPA: histidine kinase [Prolixibacteraceae bacterium]|jgi:LytS/YehU family sensor histidine kinase